MLRSTLIAGAQALGIRLTETAVNAFTRYYEVLESKNRVMNLTAITDEKDAAELHFLDSLALLKLATFENKRVIDIGSGAGFPGVPMKLAEPGLSLGLLDAQQKRVDFLEELCAQLDLKDVECIQARAEEASHKPDRRDAYDYAVSRAVARLNVLCELSLPFVKPGGTFIALMGVDSVEELEEARRAAQTVGGDVERSVDYEIPGRRLSIAPY
jgi:16S rRNA (guanine527-N7)-methyltransferase